MIQKVIVENELELKLLKSEFDDLQRPRFSITFEDDVLVIDAQDGVAMKAALNSVKQAQEIHKKISEIK
jgi:tRNA threonylcarbamoyladenosine modification (KEOPS) complex  Pcc1 subunit